MDTSPIDIQYKDLLQWLEDRYLIPKDWPSRYEIIKSKKSEVVNELFSIKDNDEIAKIQKNFKVFNTNSLDSFSYNDFSKLNTALLKTSLAKEKTFFGNYNNPLIYNSYILDKIYNKNNMFLSENSKILIQNISYEIPMLLKNNKECEYNINDMKKKNVEKKEEIKKNNEKLKNILISNDINFNSENINSNDIANNLIGNLNDDYFKDYLNKIENNIKGNEFIKKGMEIYDEYYKLIEKEINEGLKNNDNNNNNKKEDKKGKGKNKKGGNNKKIKDNNIIINKNFETFTPKLKKFFEFGDYIIDNDDNNINNNNKEIREKNINKKITSYKMKFTDQADIKSYNFNIVNDNNDNNNENKEKNSNKNEEEKIFETCLLNNHEKTLLISEINEIIIFLEQRISNISNKNEINLTLYLPSFKQFNLNNPTESLLNLKQKLIEIVNIFNDKKYNFICDIYNDENNLKNIIETFNEIKIMNNKIKNLIENNEKKEIEIENEIKDNNKKINELKKNSISLRKITEVFLTKNLKRKINIIGDEYLF